MDLPAIQAALRERNIDAWLFYDHHHRDPIAYRVLGLPASLMVTRRWFYLIPAEGEPLNWYTRSKLGIWIPFPARSISIRAGRNCLSKLKAMLAKHRDLAMQYSPNNIVFTVSLVDGGTIDLLRGLGQEHRKFRRSGGAVRIDVDRRADPVPLRGAGQHRFDRRPRLSKRLAGACAMAGRKSTKFSSGSWKRFARENL